MDDGLLDSIARRVIKIILTEKTVVHRYCLWTLQFPLFEPLSLSLSLSFVADVPCEKSATVRRRRQKERSTLLRGNASWNALETFLFRWNAIHFLRTQNTTRNKFVVSVKFNIHAKEEEETTPRIDVEQ